MRLEGIICKRADASYRAGRSTAWLKIKCLLWEEFVILGWLPPGGRRQGIGALAVGFYDAEGRTHYAGSVGTGFSDLELLELHARLRTMAAPPPVPLVYAGDRRTGISSGSIRCSWRRSASLPGRARGA
jgi:bifunctional non-homologous end joining protein LigD